MDNYFHNGKVVNREEIKSYLQILRGYFEFHINKSVSSSKPSPIERFRHAESGNELLGSKT